MDNSVSNDIGEVSAKEVKLGETQFTESEIHPIMDGILNFGYGTDKFNIGKHEVVIRTRFSWENRLIYTKLDSRHLSTTTAYTDELARYTIAASLVKFGVHEFSIINTGDEAALIKSLDERYEFVNSLNEVFEDILRAKLQKFDVKQRYIIDNFDTLLASF